MKRPLLLLLMICVVAGIGALKGKEAFLILRDIDKNYLHESLKDIRAQLSTDEDWRGVLPSQDYDYAWLEATQKPIKIAHALGGGNRYESLTKSIALGFTFYEVDVWLDAQGYLRCHHGPQKPAPYQDGDCILPELLHKIPERSYLVLDIKTDFAQTSEAVFAKISQDTELKKVIFQLYKPQDLIEYNNYNQKFSLNGPIVTIYNAQRAAKHISGALSDMGFQVMTMPLPRLSALPRAAYRQLTVMTHPVHSCSAFDKAIDFGASGVYMSAATICLQ